MVRLRGACDIVCEMGIIFVLDILRLLSQCESQCYDLLELTRSP